MKPLLVSLAWLLALLPATALAQQTDNGATRRSNNSRVQRLEPAAQQRSTSTRDLNRVLRQRDQAENRLQRIRKPLTGQTSRPANAGPNVVRTQ